MSQLRYILYARKSEEDRKRQVRSIPDQVKELRRLAADRGLLIVDEVREEHSAKAPGRPLFDDMVRCIKARQADGILVWSINRLFRNPVDHGTISWMLQQRRLLAVQTMDKEYLPSDNVVLLSVESAVANQFIIDLTKGTMRGMKSKVEQGGFPHRPPLGYLNDKVRKTIIVDEERFPIIRKAWEMLLSGAYTSTEIQRYVNVTGFRTPIREESGGDPLARNTLYNIFGNPFYTGQFRWRGTLHRGQHTPMVTPEEFARAQVIRKRKFRRQPKKHDLAYTGLIHCACGGTVCGCLHTKKVIASGDQKSYVYYRCTNAACTAGKRTIPEADIDEAVDALLSRITISSEFKEWGIEEIKRWKDTEAEAHQAVYQQQHKVLDDVNRQLDNLLTLRLRDLIGDDEYAVKRDGLVQQREQLHLDESDTEQRSDQARETVINALTFAENARLWYATGSPAARRGIVRSLSPTCLLSNGKLVLTTNPLLQPLLEANLKADTKNDEFGKFKTGSESRKTDMLTGMNPIWGGILERMWKVAWEHSAGFPKILQER